MIIDVSRKPLLVLPDEMADQVIIRSIGNREVTGLVTFLQEAGPYAKRKIVDVLPEAQEHRGTSSQFETRLPLPGAKPAKGIQTPFPVAPTPPPQWLPLVASPGPGDRFASRYDAYVTSSRGPERESAETPPQAELAPEPYEVASVYRDLLTGYQGTWRIAIRIEKHKNGKIWVVSVTDLGGSCNLVLATKSLDPNPTIREKLPMNRAQRTQATGTAWDRILDDD